MSDFLNKYFKARCHQKMLRYLYANGSDNMIETSELGHWLKIIPPKICCTIFFASISSEGVPGRVMQSVGHLTRKSEVLGSIPGLAAYFSFSFR